MTFHQTAGTKLDQQRGQKAEKAHKQVSRQQPGQEARPCPPSSTCEDLLCLPTGNTVTQPTATWPTRKTPPHPPPKSLTRKLPSPLGHMPSVRFQNRVPKTPGPFVRLTVTWGGGGGLAARGYILPMLDFPQGEGPEMGLSPQVYQFIQSMVSA